jgi:hypothetical protein
MQSSSASFTDALSAEEVCPLCLDLYTAADECTCVVCRAPSCPGCAETVDADGAMRCFACRPAQLDAQPEALAARQTLSLPRPIALRACAPELAPRVQAQPPPLPFPLTTSPRGVRSLKPRPTGSVFVGLPSVPAELSETQHAGSAPAAAARFGSLRVQALRTQLTQLQRKLERSLAHWSQRGVYEWRMWQQMGRLGLERLKHFSQSRLAKPLALVSARLLRARSLPQVRLSAPPPDHSRPISL